MKINLKILFVVIVFTLCASISFAQENNKKTDGFNELKTGDPSTIDLSLIESEIHRYKYRFF